MRAVFVKRLLHLSLYPYPWQQGEKGCHAEQLWFPGNRGKNDTKIVVAKSINPVSVLRGQDRIVRRPEEEVNRTSESEMFLDICGSLTWRSNTPCVLPHLG